MGSIKSILKYHHGIYEWLLVRFSAMLMLLYLIYFFCFILFNASLSYNEWHDFFDKKINKIFSILTLISMLSHTWIGMRHILEDYIKKFALKILGIWLIITILLLYLSFGIIVIWSV